MNSPVVELVPSSAPIGVFLVDAIGRERQRVMILKSAELNEALQEELTKEAVGYLLDLIDTIRVDLVYHAQGGSFGAPAP